MKKGLFYKSLLHSYKKNGPRHFMPLFFALVIFFAGIFIVWASSLKIPNLSSFGERRVSESTKIYDRTGEVLLYDVNQNTKRTVVPFEEISRNLKNATIAVEDREFYGHKGFKPTAFVRAALKNLTSLEFSQGGSTITQQVIKNTLLKGDKTISRKLKEIILALKLERVFSKDEILALYLNEIPYGGSLYGAEEASRAFFGKSVNDITLAEAAYLAAIPKAPTYYSPYGSHRKELEQRKNIVLREMLANKFISESEHEVAKNEKVVFATKESSSIKAPHFVFFVLDYLEKKYGEDTLENGGLRVVTTLDYKIEQKGEEIARRFALENKKTFNAENAAFVVVDPRNGDILAMVGSRDYFDNEIDGNFNIATAERQPGSTFKPFVYAEAFRKGYTPETVLFDVKTQFQANCAVDNPTSDDGCYSPNNYDNKFRGPITLRESLAQSINITSVKTLYLAGVKNSIELARNLGISTLADANRYGLTLVLGGGEVTLLDMTSAYGVFANEGERISPRAILNVTDKNGELIEEAETSKRTVLDRDVALKISSILSDNVARAPAFGQSSHLHFENQDVAVKTGTTDDYRDVWIIGYTPNVVVGAWAGNNDNSPMEKKVAGFIVAPMWRAFADEILASLPVEYFPAAQKEDSFDLKPVLRGKWQGGISFLIDSISKKKATAYTPKETTVEYLSGGVHSILHWVQKDDPRGPAPLNPGNDPQYSHWEYGVQNWLSQNPFVSPVANLPSEIDDAHTPQNSPKVAIISPQNRSVFRDGQEISVSVTLTSRFPVKNIQYFVNGTLISEGKSTNLTFNPSNLESLGQTNSLRVVVTDEVWNHGEAEVVFDLANL